MNAVVGEKGQVTIPAPLRAKLGIAAGSRLEFEVDEQGRLSATVLARGSRGLAGLLARPGEPARSLEQMDEAVSAAVQRRSRPRR